MIRGVFSLTFEKRDKSTTKYLVVTDTNMNNIKIKSRKFLGKEFHAYKLTQMHTLRIEKLHKIK